MHDHFSITSPPWPSLAMARAEGRECQAQPQHGDDGWACSSPKALEVMVMQELCSWRVGHCHLGVSFTPPSRRAVSEWAAMGACWCGASSVWCQQLLRTSREPQFCPGCFCFPQVSSVGQLSTLNTLTTRTLSQTRFEGIHTGRASSGHFSFWCDNQTFPCHCPVNHRVDGSAVEGVDPGWSRDCLLTLPVTTGQSATGPWFTLQGSGCYWTGVMKVSQKWPNWLQ